MDIKQKMKVLYGLIENEEEEQLAAKVLDKLIDKIGTQKFYLRIYGADIAQGVNLYINEKDLNKTAKELYKDQEYDYTKCLWVKYPNGEEKRLDHIVDYD